MQVKLITKINQADKASILIGILPVTNEPRNIRMTASPVKACNANQLLVIAMAITAATVIAPFQGVRSHGISKIAERIIMINATIIVII